MNHSTTSNDIVRATLDGIACRVYEVVTAIMRDAGEKSLSLKVDGGPAGNPYLVQIIADLLNLEVHVSAAREATAIGIANLAGVTALGTSLDDLAGNWRAESIYIPQMRQEARDRKLAQWNHALETVKAYHS